MFHLSKRELLEEPLEDVAINLKINEFINKKQRQDESESIQKSRE